MIKRICDCCGAESKKDFVNFCITWDLADAVSGKDYNEAPSDTPYLEYCVKCFDDLLKKLGLDRTRTIKE